MSPNHDRESQPTISAVDTFSYTQVIDLSIGIIADAAHEPAPPTIDRRTHAGTGLEWMMRTFGVAKASDLTVSNGMGIGSEVVHASTHVGTHVDAPWHYHPVSEGKPSRTIDACPLEWFFSDGVVLDLRHKRPSEKISALDLEEALTKLDYSLKPLDIVMLMTGCDRNLNSRDYFEQPGMTRESTLWLVGQGIKVIGIDAYGFDRRFEDMAAEYRETGDARVIWQAHLAGIEREYCQIEKLVNLDLIPRPTGFKVAAFPIKVEGGSAGWCRPVAFV